MSKVMSRSTAFGLYPFKVQTFSTSVHDDVTRKGYRKFVYVNDATDVQVVYGFYRTKLMDMSNPVDNKAYWRQRAAVKAAFFSQVYGK